MKNIYAFVCLVLGLILPVFAIGQDCRFSAGLVTSVDSYRHVQYTGYNTEITNRTKYSLGVSLHYHTAGRWQFKTGFIYSNKGNTIRQKEQTDSLQLAVYRPEQIKVNAHFLDIPLMAGFRIASFGNISVVPAAGLVGSIRLSDPEENPYNPGGWCGTSSRRNSYKWQLISAAAFELGLNYQVSGRTALSVAPYYRSGLNFGAASPFIGGPNSFGTSATIRYCF